MARSKDKSQIKTHVAVNYEHHLSQIQSYLNNFCPGHRSVIVTTENIGVCYPSFVLSRSTEGSIGDIVIFASDDFIPPPMWDEYIVNKLSNKEGGLFVRDGYQMPDSSNMQFPCITLPILTWGCFEKLNKIIYNPKYLHMYSDADLYLNLKDLNMLIDDRMNDSTTFEHLHHAAGKRRADDNDVKYHQKWKEDESMWNIRRFLSVEERIKI